ncbi:MAG: hydrolase 1, exosortase A system-associated [Candidatus Methylumidiphilus sp.]
MSCQETPLVFECAGCRLVGIAAQPETPAKIGVLIVVGGPQYRAGSHRQFTLTARQLAEQNIASFRFDYRGMGDGEGEGRTFEQVNEDLRCAIDAFLAAVPQVERVAIFGLCDAASAALYYAHTDGRVSGLVLLNPWVHSEAGANRARLRHYYVSRLMQRSFWEKLLAGKLKLGDSAKDLANSAQTALPGTAGADAQANGNPLYGTPGYVDRMLAGLERFPGKALVILSGADLVAQQFQALLKADKRWGRACRPPKVEMRVLPEANHTFSTAAWRDQAAAWAAQWLARLA